MNKLIVSVILFILPLSAQANFPWISEEGNGFISVSLVHEKFNDLWEGTNKTSFAPGVYIEQQTLMVAAEYAFIEDYSVDFQTGYTRSTFDSATRGDFKGLYDSNLAVRWRWIDETIEDNLPTVTFRLGVIVAGNYESSSKGNPHSPGDGESGWEGSTILGKMSHDGKIAFYGELGLRQRSGRVPDDVFYNVGLINFYSPSWSFNADVNVVKGLSGTDIK
jgi:hypothetical protein